MPITAQKSAQITALEAGLLLPDTRDAANNTFKRTFLFTQSGLGDQNSTADLCRLPAGRNRVLLQESWLQNPAITNGQCDLGHAGFTTMAGVAVAADPVAFAANKSLASAGMWQPGAALWFDYEAKDEFYARITFDGTGGVPDATVIRGYFTILKG